MNLNLLELKKRFSQINENILINKLDDDIVHFTENDYEIVLNFAKDLAEFSQNVPFVFYHQVSELERKFRLFLSNFIYSKFTYYEDEEDFDTVKKILLSEDFPAQYLYSTPLIPAELYYWDKECFAVQLKKAIENKTGAEHVNIFKSSLFYTDDIEVKEFIAKTLKPEEMVSWLLFMYESADYEDDDNNVFYPNPVFYNCLIAPEASSCKNADEICQKIMKLFVMNERRNFFIENHNMSFLHKKVVEPYVIKYCLENCPEKIQDITLDNLFGLLKGKDDYIDYQKELLELAEKKVPEKLDESFYEYKNFLNTNKSLEFVM